MLRYTGTDKHGAFRTGATDSETVDQFVRRMYAAGWRSLYVTRDDILVGAIDRIAMRRGRVWWAEKPTGPAEASTEPV